MLDNGATVARQWKLRPGVALSAQQMAQLTSDIVWLVERSVTLDDGSTTTALVPQVYARTRAGDLSADGTLIIADAVDLKLSGNLVNTGTIAGRRAVRIDADNLRNLGGRITAEDVDLHARTDLDNLGGTIDAGKRLAARTDRDLNVRSTTRSDETHAGNSHIARTAVDRVAGLYVSEPGAQLVAKAGRDANLDGARVVNAGKDGWTEITAGRDVKLGTVKVGEREDHVDSAANYLKQRSTQEIGTSLHATGHVLVKGKRDLTACAAQVTSDEGTVIVRAARNLTVEAGESTSSLDEGHQHTRRGLVGSRRATSRDSVQDARAQASTFSGNKIGMWAGNDLAVIGTNVVSDAGTTIVGGHDVRIVEARERSSESHFSETKKSGLLYSGGTVFTIGTQQQSTDARTTRDRAGDSTVGATRGDVLIVSGNQYTQTGSRVLSPGGDVEILAKKVQITEARETSQSEEQTRLRQSGLTVAVSAPVLSAIQTAQQMKSAAGQSGDARRQALAAGTTALAAKNTADAIKADPKSAGGVSVSVTVGGSQSASRSATRSDSAAGSEVSAGGKVRIAATGGGKDSDLLIQGSRVRAGGDVALEADDKIHLRAAADTSETRRTSRSASGGVGVGVQIGQGGASVGFTANASASRGKGDGADTVWTTTQVEAGDRLSIRSGSGTTLEGAVVKGRRVEGKIGGKLHIESLQDTSTFHSKDQSASASVTAGGGSFSGSANVGQQKIDSDYASVTTQSGIRAGDGGFDIRVGGNTHLKGGVITSTDKAKSNGLNRLTTASITREDIENRASYKASSVSVGGGFSRGKGDSKGADGTKSGIDGVGANQKGEATTGGAKTPGSDRPTTGANKGGFSATPPLVMGASGKSHSTTRSGVSDAVIVITDPNAQARTGQSLASLNRDVSTERDDANALKPIFDEKKIKAGFEIVGTLQRQTGTFLNNRAKEADSLKQARDKESDPTKKAELDRQYQGAAKWAPGGTYRQVATALAAAAGGNVTGSTANFATTGLVNYVQQQGAGWIGDQVAKGSLKEGSPEHTALHAIIACTGAAATSQSCGAGAMGAATASLATNLFADDKALTQSEKEARRNLIGTLVAGTAALADPNAAAVSTNAATAATDNNWLAHTEILALNKSKWDCTTTGNALACSQKKELEGLSKQRDQQLAACEGSNSANCQQLRDDVRRAYADILRSKDILPPADDADEGANTQSKANSTMSSGERMLGQFKGLKDSFVAGAKGAFDLALSLAENQALADAAYAGDKGALARLQAKADGIWETAKTLAHPQALANLTSAQRESLAWAYESGDAAAIGHAQGEALSYLANLPGGAGLGVVKNVGKVEDVAKAANNLVKGRKGSPIPSPTPTVATNGLVYKSNPKHTPGQHSNRPNAGVEPPDSLKLFGQSIPSSKHYPNKEVRFAVDTKGNIHRFEGTNGEYHWNGSTGDAKNPLNRQDIPNEVKKQLGKH